MGKSDFGDGFLRAEDLIKGGVWSEREFTVKAIHGPGTIKSPDGKPIDKPVLEFEETPKRMVLGSTNSRLMKYETGATTCSECIGKRIVLYPAVGNWFGQQNVTTKRIRITGDKPKPFLKAVNVGTDITGKRFAQENAKPKETPSQAEQEAIRQQELEDSQP